MAERIERMATWVDDDGFIHHSERVVSIEFLEDLVGRRLDRRRSYAVIGGEVHLLAQWTQVCSGCADDREYVINTQGGGCEECGYTGRVRHAEWQPIKAYEPMGRYEMTSCEIG